MKFRSGFFIIIFFLLSCSEKYDNSNLKIFKYNESNGVSTLDPAFAKDKATIWVTSQIFNSLVKMNEELEVIPSISSNWKISEDAVYLSTLRWMNMKMAITSACLRLWQPECRWSVHGTSPPLLRMVKMDIFPGTLII